MGSFLWDQPQSDIAYAQYYNGRPLSVALIEEDTPDYVYQDFVMENPQRSRSLGRKVHRQSYNVYYPNVKYQSSTGFSPVFSPRGNFYGSSGDVFVEKLETVMIEEGGQQNRYGAAGYVRTGSPMIRQLKIRSRPSLSSNLHNQETTNQQRKKHGDEQHEEYYEYEYQYDHRPDRSISSRHDTPSTRTSVHDATTSTEDLPVPVAPKPIRPRTRDTGTATANLPKRALSKSETQILERYEVDEKFKRDSISSLDQVYTDRSHIKHSYHPQVTEVSVQYEAPSTSRRTHRRDFMQRMYTQNGAVTWNPYKSLTTYSDYGRDRMVVRPTAKPREALVDSPSIIAPPSEAVDMITPSIVATRRSYFTT